MDVDRGIMKGKLLIYRPVVETKITWTRVEDMGVVL